MDLESLAWEPAILDASRRPGGDAARDPRLVRGLRRRGRATWPGVPIAGDLGDQQAALFGQTCFEAGPGQVHLRHRLLHAHAHGRAARSTRAHGLITTVAARLGRRRPPRTRSRARSRSPARSSSGCATTSGIIGDASEVEALARSVPDSGDVVFVPAFSRPVRPALAERRARRHRRADPLRDARPTSRGPRSRRRPTRSTTSTRRWPPTSARRSRASCGSTAG